MKPREHIYLPLDKTKKSIRLLQINPPQPNNDSLTCTLTPFIVDEKCPPYIALSYTWGRKPPKHEIQVNGHTFQVRPNLLSALRQLPDCKERINASYFWIDAICINQTDTSERNHQVAMMRDIYRRATAVFAWLGPGFPDSDLAMEALRHNESVLKKVAEPATARSRLALNKLFNNPYFTRLWVVQEFILAKDLWILCGAQMCTWTQFRTTLFWKSQTHLVRELIQAKARDLATVGILSRSTLPLGFLEAISRFSFRDCSEVRDKVYGLLGIIPQCDVHFVEVDYDISVERLFFLTANWQRAVNSWLWVEPQTGKHYLYDSLGKLLQVNSEIVYAQKLMDQVVAYITYRGIPEPWPTSSPHGLKWSMEYFEKQAYSLLKLAKIDIDGSISLDEAFECLMQDPKISGGLDDPAGWRAYESEIKAALRLINGESWEDIGPMLQKEKPAGCCCDSCDFNSKSVSFYRSFYS